jgi:hypothetical protein
MPIRAASSASRKSALLFTDPSMGHRDGSHVSRKRLPERFVCGAGVCLVAGRSRKPTQIDFDGSTGPERHKLRLLKPVGVLHEHPGRDQESRQLPNTIRAQDIAHCDSCKRSAEIVLLERRSTLQTRSWLDKSGHKNDVSLKSIFVCAQIRFDEIAVIGNPLVELRLGNRSCQCYLKRIGLAEDISKVTYCLARPL